MIKYLYLGKTITPGGGCVLPSDKLRIPSNSTESTKVAIAVFFVAIMIGATFFAAFRELPDNEPIGSGDTLIVWDMNIYKKREDIWNYYANGLSLQISFPETLSQREIRFKNTDFELSYELIDILRGKNNGETLSQSLGRVYGNSIIYEDVFTNVDVEYRVGVNGLKEYIILKERPSFIGGDLEIRSQLHYPPTGLEPVAFDLDDGPGIETTGFVSMLDSQQEEVLRIAPPFVFDSADMVGPTDDGHRGMSVLPSEYTPPTKHISYGRTRIVENENGAA